MTEAEYQPGILGKRGQKLYEEKLRAQLMPMHKGEFLAIEPDSERYFLAKNMNQAFDIASEAMPGQLFYVMRVGYPSAAEFGYAPFESEE